MALHMHFNPRSPCGERHARWTSFSFRHSDFNPRSPCGERRFPCFDISLLQLFQPTLPMRGATRKPQEPVAHFLFQPTLPMRGATSTRSSIDLVRSYFNPRSPCGERLDSISRAKNPTTFQPTLPMRGATRRIKPRRHQNEISTHAPHAGSDITGSAALHASQYFNPRSPCGERLD